MRPEHGHPAGASLSSSLLSLARLLVVVAAPIAGYAYAAPVSPVTSSARSARMPDAIAVLPFDLTSTSLPLSDLRDAIQDLLASRLDAEGAARVLDPREVRLALLGEIEGTPERLVVEARLISVADGATRSLARVEGTADRLPSLTDQLAVHVLATQAARDSAELAAMSGTSLPALRAYLAGVDAHRRGRAGVASEATLHFERALFLDSTFTLAALRLAEMASIYGTSERDELWKFEAIWKRRDRLGAADRALLTSYLGPRYPAPATLAELIAAAERASLAGPTRAEAWHTLGEHLLRFGSKIGYPGWEARASYALRRAYALDSTDASTLAYLVLLSVRAGDTAAVRRYAGLYSALNPVGSHAQFSEFYRWLAAIALGDSAGVAAVRSRFGERPRGLRAILDWAQTLGIGLDDAEHAKRLLVEGDSTGASRRFAVVGSVPYLLNRGRPDEASRLLATAERGFGERVDVGVLDFRIYAALFWDGDSSEAAAAATSLQEYLDGGTLRSGQARDRAMAACALAHWRLAAGDYSGSKAALGRMRRLHARSTAHAVASMPVCAASIEAQLAAAQRLPNRVAALEQLDTLLRAGYDVQLLLPTVASVIAARLYEARGDRLYALALTRRRAFWWNQLLSTQLREEGRLASLVGDNLSAIRAYRHYLALRSDPEPRLRPEVERVRRELAELTSR